MPVKKNGDLHDDAKQVRTTKEETYIFFKIIEHFNGIAVSQKDTYAKSTVEINFRKNDTLVYCRGQNLYDFALLSLSNHFNGIIKISIKLKL